MAHVVYLQTFAGGPLEKAAVASTDSSQDPSAGVAAAMACWPSGAEQTAGMRAGARRCPFNADLLVLRHRSRQLDPADDMRQRARPRLDVQRQDLLDHALRDDVEETRAFLDHESRQVDTIARFAGTSRVRSAGVRVPPSRHRLAFESRRGDRNPQPSA